MHLRERIRSALAAVEAKRMRDGKGWEYMYQSITEALDLMLNAEIEDNNDPVYRQQLSYGLVRILLDDDLFTDSDLGIEIADIANDFKKLT